MVSGPPTEKDLPKEPVCKLPTVELDFEPIAPEVPETTSPRSPSPATAFVDFECPVIIKGSSRKCYYIASKCADCTQVMHYAVRTSPVTIWNLQQLLTRDLHLLCPTCEQKTRRRKRNGRW
uniref:Early protein E7 n=1 Tax=Camelus dromedarius papillomavirus 1 TaxID=996650 RepID=A0A7D7QKE1_9PAPI|nr:early protein E7 [Camelus dromedarius papillomavirus 1]